LTSKAAIPPLISYYPGALSPEECRALVHLSESAGYRSARITGELHGPFGFTVRRGRDNDRAAVEDAHLASVLWRRVARLVPAELEGRAVVGLNERLRFYRYQPGQSFGPHTDGYYSRAGGEQSLLTFMLYLNDGYEGGETYFIEQEIVVRPRTGMALFFSHHIWHAGYAVTRGLKYILRTDVMYGPDGLTLL
jgi:prolyl 4-hydroxylase